MDRVITDLGTLNAQIDEDRRNGIRRETSPVSPGSEVQVALDDSKQWRSAKVLEAFGDRITARVSMVDGSELVRNNVAHETDPIINTIQYRELWSAEKSPSGGIWKHSDDQIELRDKLMQMESQLSELRNNSISDDDFETPPPRRGRRKAETVDV